MRLSTLIPPRDYLCNRFVGRIPFSKLRMTAYRHLGVRVGTGSFISMSVEVLHAPGIVIADNTIINSGCYLDARGGLTIGENVNISPQVMLQAGYHDVNDPMFYGDARPITIEDYVWLCTRCTILGGVTIGRGAVVAAGAVVTKSVEPFTVVGGVPARKIAERNSDLRYTVGNYDVSWR